MRKARLPSVSVESLVAARERGFTLIELMTTLAVLIISLALAAPALTSFVRSNRLNAAQSELVSSLMLARSEAARLGTRVGVEASVAGFAGGWRVWVDADSSGTFSSGETILREVPERGSNVTITTSPSVTGVVFNPNGFLAGGALVNFKLCGPTGVAKGYQIMLEPVGLSDITEVATCP